MPDSTISGFPEASTITDTTVLGAEEFNTVPTQRYPMSLLRDFILTTGGFPTGGVFFGGVTGEIISNPANFFWDNSRNSLHIGGNSPALTALVELESSTKGFLLPRLTTLERDAIAAPAPGLLIFNTDNESVDFFNTTLAGWQQLEPLNRFTTFALKSPTAATDELMIDESGTLKKTTVADIVGGSGITKILNFKLDYNANDGSYRVHNITTSANSMLTFLIPDDFGTLTDIEMVFYPTVGAAGAGKDIDLTSEYGQIGENKAFHSETDLVSTFDLGTTDVISTYSISTVFNSLTAGDKCGIEVDQNGVGGTVRYLFIKLTYITG